MQDLINEKEFLQKPYNPWKLFYTFYAIAFIQIVLFIAIVSMSEEIGTNTILVMFLLPSVTAFTMFFYKKKNALLPIKTLSIASLILFAVYYLPVIGFSILGGGTLNDITIIAGVGAGNFLGCLGIMYLVARSKQKKHITHP